MSIVPEDMFGDNFAFALRFPPYLHHVGIDTNRNRSISNEPSCHFCNNIIIMICQLQSSHAGGRRGGLMAKVFDFRSEWFGLEPWLGTL